MQPPAPPPERVDRYRILSELGRGSMGRVYLAHDPNTDRRVALKVISASGAGTEAEEIEARNRFLLEARAAGRLQHPGIVLLYDADADAASGLPFLAMEWVEGRALATVLRERGALPWREAARLAAEVARALDHAHARGVVHRDIKPANVLVAADGRIKVSDFGIAKFVTESHTVAGMVLGTPHYMSPEQVRGDAVDGRSDLFSLGAVLYEAIAGAPPFRGDTMTTIGYKVVYVDPRPPSLAAVGLPPEIERIVLKALEKDPAARFQTGAEMAAALDAAIAAAPPDEAPSFAGPPGMPPPPGFGSGITPPPRPRPRAAPTAASGSGSTFSGTRGVEVGRRVTLAATILLLLGIAGWWVIAKSPAKPPGAPLGASTPPKIAVAPTMPSAPEAPTRGDSPGADAPDAGSAPVAAPEIRGAPIRTPPSSRSAPGPARSPAAQPAATSMATLQIVYFNRLGHGTMSVWVDGARVWSSSLEAPRDLLGKVQGEKVRFSLAVAPGLRDLEIRVSQPSAHIDSRGTTRAEFRPGELRSLRVKLVPYIPRLALDWPDEDED